MSIHKETVLVTSSKKTLWPLRQWILKESHHNNGIVKRYSYSFANPIGIQNRWTGYYKLFLQDKQISMKSGTKVKCEFDGALVHLCFELVDETECRITKRHYK
jgi:hypothetical protein